MTETIKTLESEAEILASFEVMKELRNHLEKESYVSSIRELGAMANYMLLGLFEDGVIQAVAGFRISKSLAWGKYLYIDDLVTLATNRSAGHGKKLLDWLKDFGKAQNCNRLDLDSGIQRFGAHRFYLRERMDILCYHFVVGL